MQRWERCNCKPRIMAATRHWVEAGKSSPGAFRRSVALAAWLISGFWPPDLCENKFLMFEAPYLCTWSWQPWEADTAIYYTEFPSFASFVRFTKFHVSSRGILSVDQNGNLLEFVWRQHPGSTAIPSFASCPSLRAVTPVPVLAVGPHAFPVWHVSPRWPGDQVTMSFPKSQLCDWHCRGPRGGEEYSETHFFAKFGIWNNSKTCIVQWGHMKFTKISESMFF